MFDQSKDVTATTPSKLDSRIPVIERFYKSDPIMGVSISKHCLTCAEIQYLSICPLGVEVSKVKTFTIEASEDQNQGQNQEQHPHSEVGLKIEEERKKVITSFAKENGLSQILLLNSPEIQIQKVDMEVSKNGVNRPYDTSYTMDALLDEQAESDRVYSYVGNPILEEALVFSYHQGKVDYMADLIEENVGLDVVRAGCGIYAIINYLLYVQSGFIYKNQILLIYSNDCLFTASLYDKSFHQIGFRANIEMKDIPSYIPRMIERFDSQQNQIVYVNCSNWDIETFFKQNYPRLKITPIFEDNFKGIFQAASYA